LLFLEAFVNWRYFRKFRERHLLCNVTPKYVNMADINVKASRSEPLGGRSPAPEVRWDIVELLFFAYRDFVGDADHVLEEFGFGRAHHRVMHFVQRYPGLKVADLLEVLRITKQSLGRVLKQLLDEGYIIQRAGDSDRRQRLLFATAKGEALVVKLAGLQTRRIDRALTPLGPEGAEIARKFLLGLIDHDDPDKVLEVILKGGSPDMRTRS
jgi:DNA-binding MarR family transcriptional regulator